MAKQNNTDELNALFTEIAQKHLFIETLERRGAGSLDFHDVGVWNIQAALQAAYEAGMEAKTKGRKKAA